VASFYIENTISPWSQTLFFPTVFGLSHGKLHLGSIRFARASIPFGLMWVKQCHKPSPSHHHFYRWYVYHSQSWVVYVTHINFGGTLVWSPPGDHANPIHRCNALPLREALVGIQGKRNCWSHGDSLRFRHTIRFRSWRDTGLGFRRKEGDHQNKGNLLLSSFLGVWLVSYSNLPKEIYMNHMVWPSPKQSKT
jgi:hypothetical protein